jgi:hypothetical protein
VVAKTYEETKKILEARYGDNRIIQAHLDYLEDVKPIKYATPEALNSTYIDCNRCIQALRALGEDVDGYGRVLAPKVLRAFPDDICCSWIVHAKREGISEGDMLQLMAFLGEEVDEANHTEDPWRVFHLIRLHFHSSNAPCTSQIRRDSTEEHEKSGTVLCILRFPWPLGSKLYKDHGHRRSNRQAKESKKVFPVPQSGAYRFELQKEGEGKMC